LRSLTFPYLTLHTLHYICLLYLSFPFLTRERRAAEAVAEKEAQAAAAAAALAAEKAAKAANAARLEKIRLDAEASASAKAIAEAGAEAKAKADAAADVDAGATAETTGSTTVASSAVSRVANLTVDVAAADAGRHNGAISTTAFDADAPFVATADDADADAAAIMAILRRDDDAGILSDANARAEVTTVAVKELVALGGGDSATGGYHCFCFLFLCCFLFSLCGSFFAFLMFPS
jgi:hypothetical protein